jgi:hypothetical protein
MIMAQAIETHGIRVHQTGWDNAGAPQTGSTIFGKPGNKRDVQEFFICLLKRLRYDVLDEWLHKSLKLMKHITDCSGHNKDCSRALPPTGSTGRGQTKPTPIETEHCDV